MRLPTELILGIAKLADLGSFGSLLQLNTTFHDLLDTEEFWKPWILTTRTLIDINLFWTSTDYMRDNFSLSTTCNMLTRYEWHITSYGGDKPYIKFLNIINKEIVTNEVAAVKYDTMVSIMKCNYKTIVNCRYFSDLKYALSQTTEVFEEVLSCYKLFILKDQIENRCLFYPCENHRDINSTYYCTDHVNTKCIFRIRIGELNIIPCSKELDINNAYYCKDHIQNDYFVMQNAKNLTSSSIRGYIWNNAKPYNERFECNQDYTYEYLIYKDKYDKSDLLHFDRRKLEIIYDFDSSILADITPDKHDWKYIANIATIIIRAIDIEDLDALSWYAKYMPKLYAEVVGHINKRSATLSKIKN